MGQKLFNVTSICHQGWLIEYGEDRLLIDPLFDNAFGRAERAYKYKGFYPEKNLNFSKIPSVSAIFISHEHEDHFNIETIHRFDRKTTIFYSYKSSSSLSLILKKMGFKKVIPISSLDRISIGSLNLRVFNGLYSKLYSDEIDTLAFAVWDKDKNGIFFSTVDTFLTEETFHSIEKKLKKINFKKILISSDGMIRLTSFKNILQSYFNRPIMERGRKYMLPKNLQDFLQKKNFCPCFPGLTISLKKGQINQVSGKRDFLSPVKSYTWSFPRAPKRYQHFKSFVKNRRMTAKDWKELEHHLQVYSLFLFGREVYHLLSTLNLEIAPRLKPRLAFLLKDSGKNRIYAYNPAEGCFERVPESEKNRFIIRCDVWAIDLLMLFQGELEPRLLTRGHIEWSFQEPFTQKLLVAELFLLFFHPLNRQKYVLRAYNNELRRLGKAESWALQRN